MFMLSPEFAPNKEVEGKYACRPRGRLLRLDTRTPIHRRGWHLWRLDRCDLEHLLSARVCFGNKGHSLVDSKDC